MGPRWYPYIKFVVKTIRHPQKKMIYKFIFLSRFSSMEKYFPPIKNRHRKTNSVGCRLKLSLRFHSFCRFVWAFFGSGVGLIAGLVWNWNISLYETELVKWDRSPSLSISHYIRITILWKYLNSDPFYGPTKERRSWGKLMCSSEKDFYSISGVTAASVCCRLEVILLY